MSDALATWASLLDQIKAENDAAKPFRGSKKYTTVAVRNEVARRHLADYIGIETEIVHWAVAKGEPIVVKATIRRTSDGAVLGTGHAEEIRGQGQVNATSALENAETSAIGRALAALGCSGGEFASANELDAVERKREGKGASQAPATLQRPAEPPHDPETGEIHAPASQGSAIRDAWEDGIRDALPENATERQFLDACFEQLKGEFRAYSTVRGLDGGWAKYDRIITRMQHEATDLFEDLLEVYTRAKTEIEAQQAANTEAKAKGEPILTKSAGEAIIAGIKACKDWRSLDTFMQSLERGPNAHAARHPKIRMAEAERRAEFANADPVVIGDVRIA
jgi:hypothetical protein